MDLSLESRIKIEGKIEGIISALEMGSLSIEIIAQIFKESVEYILKIKQKSPHTGAYSLKPNSITSTPP